MSEPFMITLIAVIVNLCGTLVIYSFMAFFMTRLHWHGRGVFAVLMTIFVAEMFWIAPTMIGFDYSIVGTAASYSLWFGNWLVSAFVIVLLCETVRRIPHQLEDSALLDGTTWLGTCWHIVLPLVRRELGFIAVLTVMATVFPVWTSLTGPGGVDLPALFKFVRIGDNGSLAMLAVSVITSLPVIAIFFVARRQLWHAADAGQSGPSTR